MKQYKVVLLRGDKGNRPDLVNPEEMAAAIQNEVKSGWRLFWIATGGTAQRRNLGAGPQDLVCWVYLIFEREG